MALNIPPKNPEADDQPLRLISVRGPDYYEFSNGYLDESIRILYYLSRDVSLFEEAVVREGSAFENYRVENDVLEFNGSLTEIAGNIGIVQDLVAAIEDDGRNRQGLAFAKFNHLTNRISEWNDKIRATD